MRTIDCCALCVFCRDIDLTPSNPSGTCKVLPPMSTYDQVLEEVITLTQPTVELTDWCGCFVRLQES